MARFVKGDILVARLPYSDYTGFKRRPALVLAVLPGDDLIVCNITSKPVRSQLAVEIDSTHVTGSVLRKKSQIQPEKINTISSQIVLYSIGRLQNDKLDTVINNTIAILQS